MKKFICLCLMLWLPLLTSTALAMSTQMQLADALQEASPQTVHHACHDMAMQQTDSTQPAKSTGHCNNHCLACGVCAFGCQAISFAATPQVFMAATANHPPRPFNTVFSSQLYPPALKPPITA